MAANFTFERGAYDFPADYLVPAEQFRQDAQWAEQFRRHVQCNFTHAILESNRPASVPKNAMLGPLLLICRGWV